MILSSVTSTISLRGMVRSESRKLLSAGRLTMSCWMEKLSSVMVKSLTWPSLEPFLVSTLRPTSEKLRSRILSMRMTSPRATRSSVESMTQP